MFRFIILVLVVGLIALAFYLGWVHLTTSSDPSESSITLSVNKEKFKESVGALKDKLPGQSSDNQSADKGLSPKKAEGKVQSVAADHLRLSTGKDQVLKVAIVSETDVPENLRPGDAVTVTYILVNNRPIARSIQKN